MANKLSISPWDEYTSKAPVNSDSWAATDRGWFFGPDGRARGNYLDYAPYRTEEQCPNGTIHAVRTFDHAVKWCRTVEEAKLFIQAL